MGPKQCAPVELLCCHREKRNCFFHHNALLGEQIFNAKSLVRRGDLVWVRYDSL